MPEANILLRVVQPTEVVKKFVRASGDVVTVFGGLVKDLGTGRAAVLQAAPNAAAFAFALGCEADAWLPPDRMDRVRGSLRRARQQLPGQR